MRVELRAANVCVVAATSIAVVAILRVLSANTSAPAWNADVETSRQIFRAIASQESAARAKAAQGFPGDPWSADDDFHNAEQRMARAAAVSHGCTVADSLRAIDEGLRAGWPHDNTVPLVTTAPPCHPRPIY